jgi:putative SOS response-associated peptidase YedK
MCYHVRQSASAVELKERYQSSFLEQEMYNPSSKVNGFSHPVTPVITNEFPSDIQLFQWGLFPGWATDIKIQNYTLNAKMETLTEKPSFREYSMQRCIVPVTGFYEWKWLNKTGTKKEEYLIHTIDDHIFSLAGIWHRCTHPHTGVLVSTYTILTTAANDMMSEIHNSKKRMPVILTSEGEKEWLYTNNLPEIHHGLVAVKQNDMGQIALF